MPTPFVTRRRVEFRDTDAAGIAHFSVFFVWMEQSEHEALRHLGLSVLLEVAGDTITWPRVAAACDYRSPVRFEDNVQIEVAVDRIGDRSVTYGFEFTCGDRHVATGRITAVCCQVKAGGELQAVSIPPSIAQQLGRLAR
jgi:4-hydroxybenzoyl-CoA thioesterase/acyl-CoA thioester hydrolase